MRFCPEGGSIWSLSYCIPQFTLRQKLYLNVNILHCNSVWWWDESTMNIKISRVAVIHLALKISETKSANSWLSVEYCVPFNYFLGHCNQHWNCFKKWFLWHDNSKKSCHFKLSVVLDSSVWWIFQCIIMKNLSANIDSNWGSWPSFRNFNLSSHNGSVLMMREVTDEAALRSWNQG